MGLFGFSCSSPDQELRGLDLLFVESSPEQCGWGSPSHAVGDVSTSDTPGPRGGSEGTQDPTSFSARSPALKQFKIVLNRAVF